MSFDILRQYITVLTEHDNVQPTPIRTNFYREPRKLIELLKHYCQLWLDSTDEGKDVVYRGTHTITDDYSVWRKPVRPDRNPRDSNFEHHRAMDSAIAKAGLIANRSNSVFCTSDISLTSEYGPAWVVVPIGEFNYTWSETMRDALEDSNWRSFYKPKDPRGAISQFINHAKNEIELCSDHIAHIDTELQKLEAPDFPADDKAINKNLLQQARARTLKLLQDAQDRLPGKENFKPALLHYIQSNLRVQDKELDIVALERSLVGHYRGDDGSLDQAIRAGHEIMLHCDEIFLISTTLYRRVF